MFFPQANETQDPSDMSDPSEVNQPHPVLFVQGPGRYIQVPYYVPLPTSHVYSNYAVDPSQTHWYPVPQYGNTPILNGRQTENDGTENETNVEDDRSATTSFPPPGVGLPAASTMQQHHLYQMMPPLSNHLYVGSIPSGVSVQGYVNSPIPYPASYATSIATGGDPSTPLSQPNAGRVVGGVSGGGGGGGGGGSGGGGGGHNNSNNSNNNTGTTARSKVGGGGGAGGAKITSDKSTGANDCSAAASYGSSVTTTNTPQPPPSNAAAIGQDANSGVNDASTPTSMPMTAAPPPPPPTHHHQANFMPMGPVQYSYPYFSPTGPPHPPPHMTSAQHATGSPIYIPHPSTVPMYHHAPIYNSGPTAVFSADNGISPHSTVTVPVSAVSVAHPPSDLSQPHHQQQHHHHHHHHHQQQQQQQPLPPPSAQQHHHHQQQQQHHLHQQLPHAPPAPPPSSANHENVNVVTTGGGDGGVASFTVKENSTATSNEATYKNSNLLADSAPFEPENHKNTTTTAAYIPASATSVSKEVTGDGSTLPNAATTVNESVYVSAPKTADTYDDNDDGTVAADRTVPNVENVASLMNDLNVVDSKEPAGVVSSIDAARDTVAADQINSSHDSDEVDNLSSTSETGTKNADFSASAASSGPASVSWNATNSTSAVGVGEHANVNGKTNSSPDTTSSGYDLPAVKSVSSETKTGSGQVVEEPAPVVSNTNNCKKSWASLFKETPSTAKSRISPRPPASSVSSLSSSSSSSSSASVGGGATFTSTNLVNSTVSSSAGPHHHAAEVTPNKSLSGNSSINGMPLPSAISSVHRGKQSGGYKLSAPSLADDTVLPKIGESLKNYKLDHRAVNIEPRGLENKSNYCYINAILQALLACPPFYNLMKFISHNLHHHKTKLATKQHLPIIDSVVQFVEEFKLVPQKARRDKTRKLDSTPQEIVPGKPFEPVYMYNMLSVIQNNSSFVMGQQEDAQEFLTCLLNGLNDEMIELIQLAEGTNSGTNNSRKSQQLSAKTALPANKNAKKISNGDIANDVAAPDDSDSEWKQVHPKIKAHRPNFALTRTPLSDIFRGQMRSVLAKVGDQSSSSIEPFFTLHLNIEKVNSVKQALELLPGCDNLEGVKSSRTNQEVDAYQQQYLEELPYVLLLHLKYFDYKHHTCRKIKKSIEFPIDLKLDLKLISTQSPSHPKTAPSKSRQYKLFAVVYHDGNEATKGHYITDVFHIGYGGWVRYDDARVWTVSENEVLKPDLPRVPYLLYYRRCDTIAALMQPPFEKRM